MAAATNQQVQNYVDSRIRPFCEAIRALAAEANDIKSSIGDVYANLTASNPPTSWTDARADFPPHLMAPSDVLAINTVVTNFLAYQAGEAQWPVVLASCVQPAPARSGG